MFKDNNNTPNAYLFQNVAPSLLGKSTGSISTVEPMCGCNHPVSSVSSKKVNHIPFIMVGGNNAQYYSALNIPPSKNDTVFDEIGYEGGNIQSDDQDATVGTNVQFDYKTHIYISSLAVIGLYALYRLIHRTR